MSYRKFQILRGNKANLPTLNDGEMAFCSDTKELYIGSGGTNRRIGDSETAYGVATGTNNYVVTVDKQLSTYTAGLVVNFLVQNVNTTATTLNVNGLGVKSIYRNVDEPVSAGSFGTGQIISVVYDGANFQLLSTNQKESSFILSQGDITDLISGHGRKVVLTGDSLSFNYHDFNVPNISNTADMNYSGLMSWAHILRDTIKRNDFGFVSAEDLNIIVTSSLETRIYNLSQLKYTTPFNNKNVLITLKRDNINSAITIKYKHNNPLNKAVLHMSKTNSNLACLFDVYVDGVLKAQGVDNGGNPNRYFGSEMFEVTVDCLGDNLIHTIELKNFRTSVIRPGNTDGVYGVLLSAVGTKKTDVFLTGEGGARSEWLLANIQTRILNYNPDVVCLIAGANDIYHAVGVNTYKTNMTSIVEAIYANNSNTKILLLTSPSMSHPNTPDSETIKYNEALKEVAINYNCYFIDLLKLFSRISPSLWRFDNVHLSKLGSAMLGKNVIDLLMSNHMVDAKYFDTNYQVPYNTYKHSYLLALENSWQNMTSDGFYPLQCVRQGRFVHIFGSVKSGLTTLGARIAALPEEFKPSKYKFLGAMSIENAGPKPCMLSITNGNLNVSYGVSNTHLMVDITYALD